MRASVTQRHERDERAERVCRCVGVCACMCVWVCGCQGVGVCGCQGVWVCGCVGVWVCGCVGVWLSGCVGVWVLSFSNSKLWMVGFTVVKRHERDERAQGSRFRVQSSGLRVEG